MNRLALHSGIFVFVLVFAGCTGLDHGRTVVVEKTAPVAVFESAWDYYLRMQVSTGTELQQEYETLRDQAETHDIIPVTRMALLFTVPGLWTDPTAERRALHDLEQLNLTDGAALEDKERDYLLFGRFWQDVLKLRIRIREERHELEQMREKLTQLEQANRELNQQIEALKQIEKQINRHEQQQQ